MAKKVDTQIQDAFRKFIDEPKQRIVAKGLIEDNKLFSQLNKLIVPNAFGELNVRIMMGEVKKYYDEKGKVPSYDTLDVLLMEKAKTDIEREEFKSLLRVMKEDKILSDLHDMKEHLEARVNFLVDQIKKKDRRMDEKDKIIRQYMKKEAKNKKEE